MSVENTIAKKFFAKHAESVLTDDGILSIPCSSLMRNAEKLGNTNTVENHVYDNMSIAEKRALIYSFKGTGYAPPPPEEEEEEEYEEEEEEDQEEEETEEVSLASAINYMLQTAEKDPEMTKFIKCLSAQYKDADFSLVRRLCATLAKKSAQFAGDKKFGTLKEIGYDSYHAWLSAQTNTKIVVGPLYFWNLLERLGIGCSSHASRVSGKEYLQYERSGRKIHQYDRFMVHSNYAADTEASNDEVNHFLENLRFKGHSLLYKHISVAAYKAAMAFLSTFKVMITKGQAASCAIITGKGEKIHLPRLELTTRSMLEHIRGAFTEQKIRGDSFIAVFESIARWVQANARKVGLQESVAELDNADDDLDQEIREYVAAFEVASRQTGVVKGSTLGKMFAVKGKPDEACLYLKKCRETRNATNANTFVNHGVGSVRGANMPEWVDTYHKGRHMVDWAIENGPEITRDTRFCVYGVAYGHMTPVFTELRHEDADPKNLQFYDNRKAKNSTEVFIDANVFTHDRSGAWVFDDTDAHSLPAGTGYEENRYSGDHYKVERFLANDAPVVVSKVDLKNFCSAPHLEQWEEMLTGGKYTYDYRLVKFGRLHNSECFFVAVKADKVTPFATLRGDIWGVSLCVEVANKIITKWQDAGLRMCLRSPSVEMKGEMVAAGAIWRKLVKSLPVTWPWYLEKVETFDFKTIAIMEEEQTMAEMIIPETEDYPEDNWGPGGDPEVDTEPRLLLPKMPAVTYVQGFVLPVTKATVLGYGALPELQQAVASGDLKRVIWDDHFRGWKAYVPPEKKKKELVFEDEGDPVKPIKVKMVKKKKVKK